MNDNEALCNDATLKSLLRYDDLPGVEESHEFKLALEHIEQCIACRRRLEELAAGQECWSESRAALTTDGLDEQLKTLFDLPTEKDGWHNGAQSQNAWTESVARQLLQPPSHPELMGRLGRYEVERLIGSGGMGIVFKAFDTELNRPVAIKVLAPHLAGSGPARARFAREARAAAAVVHEHIVSIHNVESNQPAPYLVMQYVAGESLQQRIDRIGPLAIDQVLRIAMQTAAGLSAAHSQGLVHRDIKPANILLEHGVERALLTDFGLARASDDASLTNTGYHLGTPQYMSPEQASGEALDVRSDLFSLGSVIYVMCTGRPPFRAETTFGVLRRITDHDPRPMRETNPEVPIWLERLVERLHAKSPSDRFQSAEEVRELLAQCLAHRQQPGAVALPAILAEKSTAPTVNVDVNGRFVSRATAMVMLATLLLLIGLTCFWRPEPGPKPSESATKLGAVSSWGAVEVETELRQMAESLDELDEDAEQW